MADETTAGAGAADPGGTGLAAAFVPPPLQGPLAQHLVGGGARPDGGGSAASATAGDAHARGSTAGNARAARPPHSDDTGGPDDGRASPSLLDRLNGDISGPGLGLVLGALNHLLHQQQWARDRLKPHAGRTLRMGVDRSTAGPLPAPAFAARVDVDGQLVALEEPASVTADVTLWLRPSPSALFDALRDGTQGLSRHLRIDGDVMLAGTLGELAQHLRWDPEDDLSRVVGDVAAHRLARLGRGLFARFDDGRSRMGSSTLQYLTREQPQLVQRADVDRFARELRQLAARLDTLAARTARLPRRSVSGPGSSAAAAPGTT